MNDNSTPEKRSRKCFYSGALLLVVVLAASSAVVGYFIFKKKNDDTLSVESSMSEPCHLAVKDAHQPILEITLSAEQSKTMLTDTQAKEFETALLEAYNDASGGCSDEFKRWMYGTSIVDQSLKEHVVLENEGDSSISHTFDSEYSLVLQVETMISCDGCPDDLAFASQYPETFGDVASSNRNLGVGLPLGRFYNALEDIVHTTLKKTITSVKVTPNAGSKIQHMSYYTKTAKVS